MAIDILVPQMGESVTEGVIAQWLKNEGDTVAADEPLVEIETDKITVEIPAPSAGVLLKQGAGEGDTVNVGDVIGSIDGNASAAAPAPAAAAPAAQAPAVSAGGTAMPAARAEAQRSGVNVGSVAGTGRGGRVLKEDVQRAASAPAKPTRSAAPAVSSPSPEGRETRKKMTSLRRRVAERLVHSQQTAAILTTFNEVDMSAVMALRSKWKQKFVDNHGVKLGFMSFFVKAAIKALKAFPAVNAELDGEEV
ncbi:MAG: 2-oxo acid dehydrogenase subunit E2, partial [Nannocystaceae bacterium]|nr:2-oxo acid dehydrogenase subunit E2 [Nannocystaceae bacterium]